MVNVIEKIERIEANVKNEQAMLFVKIVKETLRNNIKLIGNTDNKAIVLLCLNAIMITTLVPLVLTHEHWIMDSHLYIPLFLLSITSFSTSYFAAKVLQRADISSAMDVVSPSSFFLGNFIKMEAQKYLENNESTLRQWGAKPNGQNLLSTLIIQDLHFVMIRLGLKISWMRFAFKVFIAGLFLSITSIFMIIVFNG